MKKATAILLAALLLLTLPVHGVFAAAYSSEPLLTALTADSSSALQEGNVTHRADYVLDGSSKTAWVEGVKGTGVGEWLWIGTQDSSTMSISAIEIDSGYHKSTKLLEANGKPTVISIMGDDGSYYEMILPSYVDTLEFEQPILSPWVLITILDAQPGTKYEDTCITEVRLYGHILPAETEPPEEAETAPETAPETVPETEPETVPETVPQPTTQPDTKPAADTGTAAAQPRNIFAAILNWFLELIASLFGR